MLLSPSTVCSLHNRPVNQERRGIGARNMTLFRKLVDREEGRLISQNNHLVKVWICCSVAQLYLTLWPHGLKHARLPCPLSPAVSSNLCLLSRWCHPTISSSSSFVKISHTSQGKVYLCFSVYCKGYYKEYRWAARWRGTQRKVWKDPECRSRTMVCHLPDQKLINLPWGQWAGLKL